MLLIERQEFDASDVLSEELLEGVFRYCSFKNLEVPIPGFDGILYSCNFDHVEWYWGLFNLATLIETRFLDCSFLGTSFAGCSLVRCKFENCRFGPDNLAGLCSIRECLFVETEFTNCEFVLEAPIKRPVFEDNRWYGCTRSGCQGMDGLF
jgi:hypothetical protein